MFNYVPHKEKYIFFMDDNYLDKYYRPLSTKEEYFVLSNSIAGVIAERSANIPMDQWFSFNELRVYSNGEIKIIGALFMHPDKADSLVMGEFTNGSAIINYHEKRIDDGGDPIAQWEGEITDLTTGDTKIEHFESSKMLRMGVGNLSTGSNYEDYDRAPSVNWWLGRSWVEGEREELYFLVESRAMLDEVATYYGLPVPYNEELKVVLDNNLESIRFKSYDLNHLGEGHYVAVVVASVTFQESIPVALKLYETTRWNE